MRTPQLECALVERHRLLRLPRTPTIPPQASAIAMLTSHSPKLSHARRHQVSERRPAHRPIMAQIKARMQCRPSHQRRVIQHTTAARQRRSCGRDVGIPPQPAASFCSTMEPARRWHSAFSRHGLPTSARRRPRPVETPWLWGNQAIEACRSTGGSPIHGLRALQSAQEPSGRSAASNCSWRLSREPANRGKAILNLPPVLGGGCLARQVPRGCLLAVDPLIRARIYSVLPCLTLQLGSSVLSKFDTTGGVGLPLTTRAGAWKGHE
jgi:hypothetical protein